MDEAQIARQFASWLNYVLASPPIGVVAFNINLYDNPFRADLIGSDHYDADDPDWACEECWRAEPSMFDFPAGMEKIPWQQRLELVKNLLGKFLDTGSPAAQLFQQSMATTVGFVDGDLCVVCGQMA